MDGSMFRGLEKAFWVSVAVVAVVTFGAGFFCGRVSVTLPTPHIEWR